MSEASTIPVDETRFAAVVDMKTRVDEARARYNTAKADAKDKKEALDQAQETFEREFDRLVKNTRGEDLPLFNQSELLERAQADPVVSKLVERMLALGQDTNHVVVYGYTEIERQQLATWLDVMDGVKDGEDAPEPPPFLAPQATEAEGEDGADAGSGANEATV